MKHKAILIVLFALLVSFVPMAFIGQAQPTVRGPEMDVLRHHTIRMPGPARISMLNNETDFSPDQIRQSDIEAQAAANLLVTQDLGFHMGYIAYNIRPMTQVNLNRSDRPGGAMPTVTYWPLHDVEFRHALIHCYDQLAIIPPIYGYIVTPVRSLVAPAQSKYYNSGVPAHAYNPGDPFTSTASDHDSCGILKAAGYTFVDTANIGSVDDSDYWAPPSGAMPHMKIWTPLYTDAPTSHDHGQEFIADLANIGLAATTANGDRGMSAEGHDFDEYLDNVYGTQDYRGGNHDGYMVFHSLGRTPGQLYSFLHSSQDSYDSPGDSNGPGVNNATIDALTETVRYSIDTNVIEAAAKEVQELIYTPEADDADNFALAYMLLYSRSYFNVFASDLEGVVKSPGYGSDNGWTFLGANWRAGSPRARMADVYGDSALESIMIYINGLPPDTLNPTFYSTVYEANIAGQTWDGLSAVNPFNHYDIPWIATDWTITEMPNSGPYNNETWMDIDLTLRSDVRWQDGYVFDADDVEFNWEFLRDWNSINGADEALHLVDVSVTDATHCTIHADVAGLTTFYNYMGFACVMPPQIWDRTWASDAAVANYHPELNAYGTDMAPGYSAGPWASSVYTNLFGTGPYILRSLDLVGETDEMWANRNYWLTQGDVATLMADMFWEVGDRNKDGVVNVVDLTFVSFAFGTNIGDGIPPFDPQADFNSDNWVNIADVSNCAYHLLWQREYVNPP